MWSFPIACHWRIDWPKTYLGEGDGPREAARDAEAAFPSFVLSHPRFSMRIEDEVVFRGVLGLPLPEMSTRDHDQQRPWIR
ncbi:hypothetical protein [Aureimonas mangrovi]|uniref:hypothetical protein n=1 Tax=Aureimonas mangrovi TaxID=2758041 RepID=UPI00163DA71E|nr:hypothetical protein [Aureimonas mangrovi]